MSNEDYQSELKREERINRLKIPPAGGTQMMSGFNTFAVVLVIFALVLAAIAIFFFVVSGRNQTTNFGNFTKGDTGPTGPQGVRGPQGEIGPTGPQGPQGDQGVPGEIGPMGMCLNTNPACQKGDTGAPGPRGFNGTQGPIGLTGDKGDPGIQGPPGRDGRNGTDGINGVNGTDGSPGAPGICDCLNLTYASYADVNITDKLRVAANATFVFDGYLDCSGGGVFSPSCLQPLTCTNFSTCDLEANSLLIKNWGVDNSLYFSKTNVTFTSRFPYQSLFVKYGDYTVLNNRLSYFGVYASTTEIVGWDNLNLKTTAGPILIQAPTGSTNFDIYIDSQAGSVIVSAADGMTFTNNAGVIALTAGLAGQTIANVGEVTTYAGTFVLTTTPKFISSYFDGTFTHTWFETNFNSSYQCSTNVSNPALQPDSSRSMTRIGPNADLILGDNSLFGSSNPSGLVPVLGGFLLYCQATIRGFGGQPIRITTTQSETLIIPGVITNDVGFVPIQMSDPDGLDLQSTPLFNSEGGGINVTDLTGLRINNGNNSNTSTSFLATNQITSVRPTLDTLFITAVNVSVTTTNFTVYGTIHATGAITSDSTCCTSDIRVKQNLREVSPYDDLKRVLNFPRRVKFEYTDDYKATNSYLSRNLTYDGFVAQEMESAGLPTLVTKSNRPIVLKKSGKVLDDLLSLDLNQAIPYLVGSIRALYEEQVKLVKLVKRQGKMIKKLQRKNKRN